MTTMWLENHRLAARVLRRGRLVEDLVQHAPLSLACLDDYRTLDQVVERLEVLYEKAHRICAYNASLASRSPLPRLLDEKQRATMNKYGLAAGADRYPSHCFHRLRRTIDQLEERRKRLERTERRRAA